MRSIRTKIMVLFGSTATLLLVILALVLNWQIRGSIIPLTEEMSQEIITLKAGEVGNILNNYLIELEAMTQSFAEGRMIDVTKADNPMTRAAYQEMTRNDIRRRSET